MDLSPPPPRADMAELVVFESKRSGYFADEYSKTSIYWSSLCDLMTDNDGSTQQVLLYIAGKLETDRVYTSSVYANADKVFGDKKGTSKLRHDKIRHAEHKAKSKGEKLPASEDTTKAGGAGRELPSDGPVKAMWEMAEMDCRAARYRDVLCDELETEELLGKVKAMGKETHKRFKELSDEGDACLQSLRNIDKRVGQSFLHLKEVLGIQMGGVSHSEDIWFLDCSYRTAAVHQKEAWDAVSNKMKEVLGKMKLLEASRREVLRDFMIAATAAIQDSWSQLPALCAVALDSAKSVDATAGEVERDVSARALVAAEEKKQKSKKAHELPNTTRSKYPDPLPSDMSFIDSLTAPLESPLVRSKMMVERRESKPIGSKYHTGLMVLSWDGFIHFFDVPASTGLKKDVSPSAAFQGISPTISLDDLLANKKDLEEVLLFKSTATLHLDEESTVEAVSSHKSHKLEVSGKKEVTSSFKRHIGPSSKNKTVTFRTTSEAEMNEALSVIKDSINTNGGMLDDDDNSPKLGRVSTGSRSSFGSVRSDQEPVKPAAVEAEKVAAPTPAPPLADPVPAPAAPAPAPAEACAADSAGGKAPPAAEPAAAPAPAPAPASTVAATAPAAPAAEPAAAVAVAVPVAKPA